MRVLSLFAGIGGLDLGLEWAGFKTVQFVEKDPACRHWLAQHWPGVPIHDDINTFSGLSLRGSVDLICGGFPCQPFSVAGKQKGTEDERHLWPEMSRIIREVRPRGVLAENVPGLRTIAADLVLEDLEGQGYTCWPLVVGSDDVGAPHRRKRVWILAYRDGERCEGLDALLQPGGSFEDRAKAAGSGKGMADSARGGRGADWRAPRDAGPDISEPPVGEPTGEGLEGQRPDARQTEDAEPRHSMRWPSRPGEPQHAWEAPRLAHTGRDPRDGERHPFAGLADSPSEPSRSPGQPRQEPDTGIVESEMGEFADGVPGELAGYSSAHRREALKALGNSVNPWNAYYLGRAILMLQERVA